MALESVRAASGYTSLVVEDARLCNAARQGQHMSSYGEGEDRAFVRQLATRLKRQWWLLLAVVGGIGVYLDLSGKKDQPAGILDLLIVVGFTAMMLAALIVMCTETILEAIRRNSKAPD